MSTIPVTQPAIKNPLQFYPYQCRLIEDESRRILVKKSRRIGYSFASGFKGVKRCHQQKQNFIVLSRSDRLSKEFITEAVAPHVRALEIGARYINGYLPGTSIYTHKVAFDNGSQIIALPANPDTARSYEGHIVLDEYAFHKDPAEIYRAIGPSISRGYSIEIISTPNGQQGTYYELAREAGLADAPKTTDRWSVHSTDIYQAIAQGCADRYGQPLDAVVLRADCLDEDMWLQEYCGQFLSILSQWISPQLFQDCVDEGAYADGPPPEGMRGLFAGWDIARHKDKSVVWFLEQVGDILWQRGCVEFDNVPTPDQQREAESWLRSGLVSRMCVDKSGMGLSIFEALEQKFYGRVEGILFTLPVKEALAVGSKAIMERKQVRIADNDMARNSFRSIKKTTSSTGQPRFDADHDAVYGHGDFYWAFALAVDAASQPGHGLIELWGRQAKEVKRQQAEVQEHAKEPTTEEQFAKESGAAQVRDAISKGVFGAQRFNVNKVTTSKVIKPVITPQTAACPHCGSNAISTYGNTRRCNSCGKAI